MDKISLFEVGGLKVPLVLQSLMPYNKSKIQMQPDDPRSKSGFIEYESAKGGGTIKRLLSRPIEANEKLSGVVVVHKNRGLNPYIEDVRRRAGLGSLISIA